eukprot:TRINITY_DN275_c3_g1_i2.p1 TRINITY_DN275_c3_g1~~TRINITY_DN275_c3_g1_i2.p1  ORF type:complete len:198 (-),score=31.33 TRINITY_DN275_c3_g1_i2:92-685(-)
MPCVLLEAAESAGIGTWIAKQDADTTAEVWRHSLYRYILGQKRYLVGSGRIRSDRYFSTHFHKRCRQDMCSLVLLANTVIARSLCCAVAAAAAAAALSPRASRRAKAATGAAGAGCCCCCHDTIMHAHAPLVLRALAPAAPAAAAAAAAAANTSWRCGLMLRRQLTLSQPLSRSLPPTQRIRCGSSARRRRATAVTS